MLTVIQLRLPNGIKLHLKGSIDGDSQFPELELSPDSEIHIDADGISTISSAGIRRWMVWLWGIEKEHPTAQIIIENCRPSLIKQVRVINGFLPKSARVTTAFVQFFCDNCQTELLELVSADDPRVKDVETRGKEAPFTTQCKTCGSAISLDIPQDGYFDFFKKHR